MYPTTYLVGCVIQKRYKHLYIFATKKLLFFSFSGSQDYSTITIQFPKDAVPIQVPNFGQGEMATFFQEFNEAEPSFNQRRKSLTFYDTKFDLSSLARNTNASVTQVVTVKADTVYMSQPLDITYSLIIRARVISIGNIGSVLNIL